MPQIPKIDEGGRPDSGVPRATLPTFDGNVFRTAAGELESLGQVAARGEAAQRDALQKALDAKQKIVDTVTATRSAGDFEEALRNRADQIQQQFLDTPEKAPDEFTRQARQMADDAMKAAPNGAVQLELAHRTESAVDAGTHGMHTWAQLRMTQKAKSDMTELVNQATRGAEDQLTPGMLASYAEAKHQDLDPLFEKLTADHKTAKQDIDREMAKAWVTAAGARDPVGTMKALDAPYGGAQGDFLVNHLTAEDRKSLRSQVQSSFDGMGKFKHMQVLKEGVDLTGNAYDLFRHGELTSGAVYSMDRSLQQKKAAIALDPNMDEASRKDQLASIDLQSKTLRALDEANRKQSGFDAADDEGTRTTLLGDYDKLFKQDEGKAGKDLASVLKFRHDLAKEYSAGKISRAVFGTMDKGVSLALPQALAKETSNTGWSILGFEHRSVQQSGNAALNDLLDPKTGPMGNLTEKQRNDARVFYVEQLNDALENGRNLDSASAQVMARRAAYYAAGKKLPGGGK